MYLYGASGHAKVIIDILRACGIPPDGLIDDNNSTFELCGIPVSHSAAGLSPVIVSIGNNSVRKKIAERLDCTFATAIHPRAIVSPAATIGEGTVVMAGAVIEADAVIGKHCIINTGALVNHECRIGDYTHISPNATLCGNVTVGEGSHIGAGATVIPGINIGRWTTIGAGATVISDIPQHTVAVGTPARIIKHTNK